MKNNEDMDIYEAALKTYVRLIHIVCMISTSGVIIFMLADYYIMVGISVFFAFQGIKRLRWVNQLEKRAAREEGFSVAEYIFKDEDLENS